MRRSVGCAPRAALARAGRMAGEECVAMRLQGFFRLRTAAVLVLGLMVASPAYGILFYTFFPSNGAGQTSFRPPRSVNAADVALPPGYCIEPVVTGLTYPTGVVTDEQDRVY